MMLLMLFIEYQLDSVMASWCQRERKYMYIYAIDYYGWMFVGG